VTFRRGDILIIRTGWTAAYSKLTTEEKERLGGRDDRASIGVEASEEAFRWHWEQQFAAVASDTVAYEAWPSPKPWGVCMHEVLLSGWGMPIGECWDLEQLSETCRQLNRWTFLLTSQPLNLPGGVASPPNATAVF
jgi:kynurenine formamidase